MMKKLDIEARKDAADKLLEENSEGLKDLEKKLSDTKTLYKRFKEEARKAHTVYMQAKESVSDLPHKLAFFGTVFFHPLFRI